MAENNATVNSNYPLPVERAAILASLLVLAAIAWAVVVWQADSMDMNMGMNVASAEMHADSPMSSNDGGMEGETTGTGVSMTEGMADGTSDVGTMAMSEDDMAMGSGMDMGLTMNMSAALFLGVWIAMMVAMMFPTAAPMILTFAAVQKNREQQGQYFVPTWLFTLAYIALWSATGVLAYGAAIGGDELASQVGFIADNAGRLGGLLLVVAGLYQLSPWKDKCLSHCRTPSSFILGSWREGRGGAFRMGVEHGAYCLGCCWFLFAILFPLGMMNVAAMAIITLVIFAEKSLSIGYRVARVAAVGLVIYGAAVAIALPSALPTSMTI
jgi:predicted metal-binding membrane protein